tara:strand:- start:7784 stop:8014 length:231 start_codon:yes stop_codon:yes gene_type:complete
MDINQFKENINKLRDELEKRMRDKYPDAYVQLLQDSAIPMDAVASVIVESVVPSEGVDRVAVSLYADGSVGGTAIL